MKHEIGVIGLSVMGSNLALNIADHGFTTAVYNRTNEVSQAFVKQHPHKNIVAYETLETFCESLQKPRRVLLMIKAGDAVDGVIEQLLEYLEEGDIILDGGNSFFKDTQRRYTYLKKKGLVFFGTGISGGESGARFGPAIMPGGESHAYHSIQPILEAISAHVGSEPCCTFIGQGGAGHYVKMVHNGIEYADMQLISEAYRILKYIGGLTNEAIAEVFETWNQEELDSYLMRISARILKEKDTLSKQDLIDVIVDVSAQKGTGKWTNLEAIDLGVDLSMITAALNMRFMSGLLQERKQGATIFVKPCVKLQKNINEFIEDVKYSLYVGKIAAYAQGYKLLATASNEYNWNLDLADITKIFRGGCIIEAKFLQNIVHAYEKNAHLSNLIFDDYFSTNLKLHTSKLRETIIISVQNGISIPAFSNALSYLDAYTSEHIGANFIQAQRDLFGAHTFERNDREGKYHHEWNDERN